MGFMKMAMIGLVFIALAGGVSYYVTQNMIHKEPERKPGIMYVVGDPKEGLVLSVPGGHYIKTKIVLEFNPEAYAKTGEKGPNPLEIKSTDTLIKVLRSQRPETYFSKDIDPVKTEIKNQINSSLNKEAVYNVYITGFVIQ